MNPHAKKAEEAVLPSLSDFPKLECSFIRKTFLVDRENWKKNGSKKKLREPEVYLAVDQVNPSYEWVFEECILLFISVV